MTAKFLHISTKPSEWADEHSDFHRDNPISFKEQCIWDYLEAVKIVQNKATEKRVRADSEQRFIKWAYDSQFSNAYPVYYKEILDLIRI